MALPAALPEDIFNGQMGHAALHNQTNDLVNAIRDELEGGRLSPSSLAEDMVEEIDAVAQTAYLNGVDLAAGPLPSVGRLDSGHPYKVTGTGDGVFTVADGGLRSLAGSLKYLNLGRFPGSVAAIEVEIAHTDDGKGSGNDQGVVLIIANGPFATLYPSGYADTGCHLVLYPNRWVLQKRRADGAGSTGDVASHVYNGGANGSPVPYGTPASYRVARIGTRLYITRHDGATRIVVMDADMIAWCGEYATVQIVGSASTLNRAKINSFVVSSRPVFSPLAAAGQGSAAGAEAPVATALKTPGTTAVTLVPDYTTVLTKNVVIPQSKAATVLVTVPVSVSADGNFGASVNVGGNPTSVYSQVLLEGQAHVGAYTFSAVLDLSEFTPGAVHELRVRLSHSGTGVYRTATSGPPRLPAVTFIPDQASFA